MAFAMSFAAASAVILNNGTFHGTHTPLFSRDAEPKLNEIKVALCTASNLQAPTAHHHTPHCMLIMPSTVKEWIRNNPSYQRSDSAQTTEAEFASHASCDDIKGHILQLA